MINGQSIETAQVKCLGHRKQTRHLVEKDRQESSPGTPLGVTRGQTTYKNVYENVYENVSENVYKNVYENVYENVLQSVLSCGNTVPRTGLVEWE